MKVSKAACSSFFIGNFDKADLIFTELANFIKSYNQLNIVKNDENFQLQKMLRFVLYKCRRPDSLQVTDTRLQW